MNSGATSERVYDAIRRRILQHELRPGDRLDPAILAQELASSATPVREALHLLVGERLVETRTSGGFHLPLLDEPALKDMYAWSHELVGLCLRARRVRPPAQLPAGSGSIAERAAASFLSLTGWTGNAEHRAAVEALGTRLHAVRTIEPAVLEGAQEELEALEAAIAQGDGTTIRRLSRGYHGRRRRAAAAIVRAMYRVA